MIARSVAANVGMRKSFRERRLGTWKVIEETDGGRFQYGES